MKFVCPICNSDDVLLQHEYVNKCKSWYLHCNECGIEYADHKIVKMNKDEFLKVNDNE